MSKDSLQVENANCIQHIWLFLPFLILLVSNMAHILRIKPQAVICGTNFVIKNYCLFRLTLHNYTSKLYMYKDYV